MMLSILTQESPVSEVPVSGPAEFEIVLGHRQVASLLFVATVVVVVFSALSYLGGKALSPKNVAAAPAPVPAPVNVLPPPAPVTQPAVVTAPEVPQPAPAVATEPPLFAEPITGAVYIQIGALEEGISVVLAEGLRKHGLDAFVAPGPSDKVFRVLIGPLPDPASFERAKNAVDQLGLRNFARKYVK